MFPVLTPRGILYVARHELGAARGAALEETVSMLAPVLCDGLVRALGFFAQYPKVFWGGVGVTLGGLALYDLLTPPLKKRGCPRRRLAARGKR